MQHNNRKHPDQHPFKNPDTRERWQWVLQAIDVAENDSRRELEARAAAEVIPARSPFE